MKKALFVFLILFALLLIPTAAFAAPTVSAEAAILMDADTGQIIFAKNIHTKLYPASITKILTAALALENLKADDIITVSHDAVFTLPVGTSHIALDENEQISVDDLLYALMLPSANDAANVLAEQVAGTQTAFVAMMNAKAQEAGAQNSNFCNAHGLPDENHYTTAYDMAKIMAYALKKPGFLTYSGTTRHQIKPTNKQAETRYLASFHKMINDTSADKWPLENGTVISGKTGWTKISRSTMVTAAENQDTRLICVVLDCANHEACCQDTQALFNYGFCNFNKMTLDKDTLLQQINQCFNQADKPYKYNLAGYFSFLAPKGGSLEGIDFHFNDRATAQNGSISLILLNNDALRAYPLTNIYYAKLQASVNKNIIKIIIVVLIALILFFIMLLLLRQVVHRRSSPYYYRYKKQKRR